MDLNEYFQQLATEHTDIQHTAEKPAFFREYASSRILLDTDFHNNLRNSGDNVLISQFNDDGILPAPMDDFMMEQPTGTLYILCRIKETGKEAARLKAKEIRNDIYARIRREKRQGALLKDFNITSISPVTIGLVASNFYGVAINISYTQRFEASYDAEKWQTIS